VEGLDRSSIQDAMNGLAAQGYRCVGFAAVEEKRENVSPATRLKYIAVMESP
jgi:hypothetical protein